jgi:hypothetical protein
MQAMTSHAELAAQAALYALPLVIMDMTREQFFANPAATVATPNRFFHIPILANASFRAVVRPNVDTLYSTAWLDLASEPVVMTMPPSNGRYFILQCMDAWTNVFAAPGIRTLGNTSAAYAIVGPDWHGQLPENIAELRAPTQMVWVLGRIYAHDQADLLAARAYQKLLDLRPLSLLHDASFQPTYPHLQEPPATPRGMIETLKEIRPDAFFERFLRLIEANPPAPQDAPFVKDVLGPFGLMPGQLKNWSSLDGENRQVLAMGLEQVVDELTSPVSPAWHRPLTPNGWSGTDSKPWQGNYGTHYQARAAVAVLGLGANLRKDAIYLNASIDSKGKRLNGSKQYYLTFAAGNLPPARGFWSVTLYDNTRYLVANPLSRFAIRSGDKLVYEPDGSLRLILQPDDPGVHQRANWLPTPRDQMFELSLRIYWPREELLEGKWTPPPVVPTA